MTRSVLVEQVMVFLDRTDSEKQAKKSAKKSTDKTRNSSGRKVNYVLRLCLERLHQGSQLPHIVHHVVVCFDDPRNLNSQLQVSEMIYNNSHIAIL